MVNGLHTLAARRVLRLLDSLLFLMLNRRRLTRLSQL